MKHSFDKITEFLGCDLALALDADAAGVADHLTHHVLRLAGGRVAVLLPLPTYRPLGDVVWPHIWSNTGGSLAETETEACQFRFIILLDGEILQSLDAALVGVHLNFNKSYRFPRNYKGELSSKTTLSFLAPTKDFERCLKSWKRTRFEWICRPVDD